MHLITVRVELETICTVDVNVQNYHDGANKVARQTQHFIRTMSPPADLLQLPFSAINWRLTCWYVAQ